MQTLYYGKKSGSAPTHNVAEDDTLSSIAGGKTYGWEDIAKLNWGTAELAEVNRALIETVGVKKLDRAHAERTVLKPNGAVTLKLPTPMTKSGFAMRQVHPIKLKPAPQPATAIRIRSLDKWFLPEIETCAIEYGLEGEAVCADQVDLEVYGSNYCELNNWNDGLPTFTVLDGVPIYKETLDDAQAQARTRPKLKHWSGQANCEKGVLKKIVPAPVVGPAEHYLNVAFSPYMVLLRYARKDSKTPSDRSARLELAPFWLLFGNDNKATAASRLIKWKVKGTDRLKLGILQVWDKDEKLVFFKPLAAGDLTKDAEKTYTWDGKYLDGVTEATVAKMPYRVQIQAHTLPGQKDGLALAAMHTEVRLYVHKDTHPLDLDPYVAATDKSSLDLSLADLFHKDTPPTRKDDGKLWTKHALAKAGFHPGPVNDGNTNPDFESALNEFQRSVPKYPPKSPTHFERLALTKNGNDDKDTKEALENLADNRKRSWFGKDADRSDYDPTVAAFTTDLNDPAKTVIVWVDDRNWYSDPNYFSANDDVRPKIHDMLVSDPAALGNVRGPYTWGDPRVDQDALEIARPWLPLQMDFRIVGRTKSLDDAIDAPADAATAAAMRRAIGPLRVDWTFDEIEQTSAVNTGGFNLDLPDLEPVIVNTLTGLYHRERTRTKTALRVALDLAKGEHDRLDVTKHCKYYNCPAGHGGIRPVNLAEYYEKPFGVDAQSLLPWMAKALAARQSIVTMVHDHIGQPAANFFESRRGRAGVYFHPSRIAGDGYQVRAQVFFEATPDYTFPNVVPLKARYARLPQAHTAKFRLWRKSSLRGYVCWGPTNSWTGGPPRFRDPFTACHVHLVNELDASNADLSLTPNQLFPDLSDYRSLVNDCVKLLNPRRTNSWIQITPTRIWPWASHNQFGVPEPSAPNMADQAAAMRDIMDRHMHPYWWKYNIRLSLEIVRRIEKLKGRMRGHVIVEFEVTDPCYYRPYQCKKCGDRYVYLENAAAAAAKLNATCPTKFCLGKLRRVPAYRGRYQCGNGHLGTTGPEDVVGGGKFAGSDCPACAAPKAALVATQVPRQAYRCDQCAFEELYPEPGGAPGGSHANEACPCLPCTGQMISRGAIVANGNHVDILPSRDAVVIPYGNPMLPVPSVGGPIGVSLNFASGYELWAHELAHNRYYEHAGNAPGANVAQHDTDDNTTVNWGAPINEADPINQKWDRACLMTYASHMASYDAVKDLTCFCYRCVLKNRGWRLDGLPGIVGAVQDP